MANLEKKSFDNPDELKEPEKTKASVVNFGSVAASKVILQPGWKWSECIKPVVETKSCEAGHVGMILKGTIKIVHDDGSEMTVSAERPFLVLQDMMLGLLEMKRLYLMSSTIQVKTMLFGRVGNKPL